MSRKRSPELFGEEESGRALDRLVAFSDGVFAIAMTLLVLSLTVPDLTGSSEKVNDDLWNALQEQWPEVVSYIISFAVIGRYWLIHHRIFRLVRRADTQLLIWNLVLLALIAVLPFPTELLGRYGDTTTAVVVYSVTLIAIGLVSIGMTRHIYFDGLLDDRVTAAYKRQSMTRATIVPIGFALGIPVAFIDPVWGMWTWWLAIVAINIGLHRYFDEDAIRHPFGAR